MKINFVNRNIDTNSKSSTVNAQNIIDYFLSLHPNNKLIPNSPLYNLAVKQYNTNITNTKTRKAVPSWFCGKVNPVTNELLLTQTDEELRAASGVVLDSVVVPSTTLTTTLSTYKIDTCLALGPPGSYAYSICSEILTPEILETSGVDWVSSIEVEHTEQEVESYRGEGGDGGEGDGESGGGDSGGRSSGGRDSVNLSGAKTYGSRRDLHPKNADITATLNSAKFGSGSVSFSYERLGWPTEGGKNIDGSVLLFWRENGTYIGGQFDYKRQGQTSKGLENITGGRFDGKQPSNGATCWLVLMSNNGKERTNNVQIQGGWRG